MSFKLVSGAESALTVHLDVADAREFAAKVNAEFLSEIDSIPFFNHAFRIVLPNNDELRSMRAKRWLTQNS